MEKGGLVVLLYTIIHVTVAWKQSLTFSDCWSIYYVNNDHSYEITWNGGEINSPCEVTFHGYDLDNVLNEYKVCLRASSWNITDAGSEVELTYYMGDGVLDEYLEKTFSKHSMSSATEQWCSEGNKYVDVKLKTSSSFYPQGKITLQVSAQMTYNYYKSITWIIGGTIGGVALLILLFSIVIVICCRRRQSAGVVYNTPNIAGNTILTQSGAQQLDDGGFSNQGYWNHQAPPSYYHSTNTPYPSTQETSKPGVHQKQ